MTRAIDRTLAAVTEDLVFKNLTQKTSEVPERIAGTVHAVADLLTQDLLCNDVPHREALAKVMEGVVLALLEPQDTQTASKEIAEGIRLLLADGAPDVS